MPKLQPKTISQSKLGRYLELEALVKEFNSLKQEIIQLANDGLPCQAGRFSCFVKIGLTTSIPWKEKFVEVAGQAAADEIMEKNKGNATTTKLIVTDRDNPLG